MPGTPIDGPFIVTLHAEGAAASRGLGAKTIDLALALKDRAVHVGNGREAWSVSRAQCRRLRDAGLPAAVVERLGRTILVVDPARRTIITVINGHPDSHRRYRRGDDGRPRYAWKTGASGGQRRDTASGWVSGPKLS